MFVTIAYVIGSVVACLLAADFLGGIFHWLEDTWGEPGKSVLLDKYIIQPNIEHHRRPGRMRENTYLQTNAVTIMLTLFVTLVVLLCRIHIWQVYVTLLILSHSNQYHQWAHCSKKPFLVEWLQRFGILQSTAHHGIHHKAPYAIRHCTTTNYLNPILDGIKFWRGVEWLVERCGIKVKRCSVAREGF